MEKRPDICHQHLDCHGLTEEVLKASQTQETWSNVLFPDWGTYSVSPPTYIHVLEIK